MLDPAKNKIIIDYFPQHNPVEICVFGSYTREEHSNKYTQNNVKFK